MAANSQAGEALQLPPDLLSQMGGDTNDTSDAANVSAASETDPLAAGEIPGTTETSEPTISATPTNAAATIPSEVSGADVPTAPAESPAKQFLRRLAAIATVLAPPLGVAGGLALGPTPQQKMERQIALKQKLQQLRTQALLNQNYQNQMNPSGQPTAAQQSAERRAALQEKIAQAQLEGVKQKNNMTQNILKARHDSIMARRQTESTVDKTIADLMKVRMSRPLNEHETAAYQMAIGYKRAMSQTAGLPGMPTAEDIANQGLGNTGVDMEQAGKSGGMSADEHRGFLRSLLDTLEGKGTSATGGAAGVPPEVSAAFEKNPKAPWVKKGGRKYIKQGSQIIQAPTE